MTHLSSDQARSHFQSGVSWERDRIRAALKTRCNLSSRCGLNTGHIGQCSPQNATVTVSMARLEEILDG